MPACQFPGHLQNMLTNQATFNNSLPNKYKMEGNLNGIC